MAFSEELFRVIKADRYQGAGSSLGFGLGPIYLLQETHEPALKTTKPKGLHNDGHCFRTAGGQLVALTRCWKWNKGWKGWQARAPPQAAQPPDLAAVQAHIMAALETDLLDKIMILVEQWPQYYGSLTRALVEELVPKGLCLNPADASQAAYRGRSRRELVPAGPAPPAPGPKRRACRTSAQGLLSLHHPANALSPTCAARKTSLNGSLLWQTFKRWSNRRCTESCRRQSSGRSGGRVWRPR